MFQLSPKCRQRISQNDVVRQAVPAKTQVWVFLNNIGSWTSRISVMSTKIIVVESKSQPWSHHRLPVITVCTRLHTSPRSGYFQPRQLHPPVQFTDDQSDQSCQNINSSIRFFCRLDYCNSLLYGVSDGLRESFSLSRTLPHGSLPAPDDVITSHFLSGDKSTTNPHAQGTRRCVVCRRQLSWRH